MWLECTLAAAGEEEGRKKGEACFLGNAVPDYKTPAVYEHA